MCNTWVQIFLKVQNRTHELPVHGEDVLASYFVSVSKHVSCFKAGIVETASIEAK